MAIAQLDRTKAPYELAEKCGSMVRSGLKIGVYPSLIPSVNYYLDAVTPVFKEKDSAAALDFMARGGLILANKEDVPAEFGPMTAVWEGPIGDDTYVLIASAAR